MRALLGAASVEVQLRFAGDLLHVTELSVVEAHRCYQVGLATTAQLPLPTPPFRLLEVVDDQLALSLPDWLQPERPFADGAQLGAHETVLLKWQAVEIAVVPSLSSRAHRLGGGRRSWPVELLSSSAATVIALLGLFPAALLLLALGGRSSSSEESQTRAAHIVYHWKNSASAQQAASERARAREPRAAPRATKTAAAAAAKNAAAASQPQSAQAAAADAAAATTGTAAKSGAQTSLALRDHASGDADAPAHDDDSGFAGSAAAGRASAAAQHDHHAAAAVGAREAAAHAGILGVFEGRVQIAASASVLGGGAGGAPSGGGASGSPSGGGGASGASAATGATGDSSASSGATSGDSSAASGNTGDGALQGADTGDAFGEGGLGLSGSGAGGGGSDEGTIGLGDLGTIGHGSGTGSGYGYGRGMGGLGGRRAYAPMIVPGVVTARGGGLDKEMIRRVIREHINEVRFCYESALQNAPDLSGRVRVEFLIQPNGSVASSSAQESTLADPTVGACVAGALRRWQFPSVSGGGVVLVHYPFDFVPAGL